MGDVRGLVRPRRSWAVPVMLQQRGESSSVTRKRPRPSAPLPLPLTRRARTPRHRRRRRDDEHQQSGRSQDERESSSTRVDESSESSGGSGSGSGADDDDDVVLLARRVLQELQSPAEEEGRDSDDDDDDDRPIPITATAPPAPRQPPSPSFFIFDDDITSSVIKNVTVDNSSALDCTICYHPLKSPIFQCTAGHVVCSPCHDKLEEQAATDRCHICRVPTPGGYSRCNAMEKVLDSIRVPCPNAAYGCAETRLAYHDRDAHAQTCAHRPCHCPADSCGFVGNVQTTLLQHFAAVHGWPCTAGGTVGASGDIDVCLRNGINVVTATTEEGQYTLVLNVAQAAAPVCNAITAFCIHPSRTGTVRVGLSYYRRWRRHNSGGAGGMFSRYLQSSQLEVVCTDLSDGMPAPSSCFPLLVPRWRSAAPAGGEEGDDDDISITVNYVRGGGDFL